MVGQEGTGRPRPRARLGVAGQLRFALGASILVLAAILAVAFYVPYELNRLSDRRYVDGVIPLNRAALNLVSQVATGEAAAADFILTGTAGSYERYIAAFDAANRELSVLDARAGERPALAPLTQRATVEISDLHGAFERRIRARDETPVAGRAQTELAEVRRGFDRLRATTSRMLAETERLVGQAQSDQHDAYRRLLVILGALGSIGLFMGAALFVLTPRRLGDLYRAEQEARREAESRADAARALAHVSDGVVLTGDDGGLRFWNPAAAALLGLGAGEDAGRRLPELVPGWRTAGTTNGGAHGPVVVPLTTSGGERWLSVTSVDFGDGVVYAMRDVTEERVLDTMRSDLLATASHELRTPMTSIYGAARTLLARDGELTPDRRVTFLEMIAAESERLARIIDGILLASRLDAGEVDLDTEHCDVVALCRSVLDTAEVRAPANVSLCLDAPTTLPPVACDPNRLRQVLLNLVDNAIKYSPRGGEVVLSVALADPVAVRFTVRDQGIGFPPEEAARIFERFYRVDPGLRQGIGGTGLGLYISRELVERMGGRISAESAEGAGSSFTVELPLVGGGQAQLPAPE